MSLVRITSIAADFVTSMTHAPYMPVTRAIPRTFTQVTRAGDFFFLSLVSPILKSDGWDKSLYSRRQSILITRNMMFLYPSSFVSRPSQTFNNRSDSLMGYIAFRSVPTILSRTTKSNLSCKKRSNKRTSLVKSIAWNEQELQRVGKWKRKNIDYKCVIKWRIVV